MIVIPAVDVLHGKAVRLLRGNPGEATVYADDPADPAAGFARDGAERVHVVDLDAALGDGENTEAIRRVAEAVPVRIQVGGGLRSLDAIERVLAAGADRVVLGTEAVANPPFLAETLENHDQRVIVALDTEHGEVRVKGWTEDAGPFDDVLARLDAAGAPRYLITAVARDGTMEGPDLELYRRTLALTDRPVLASGGVGSLDDLRALATIGVEGVIVGKALYEGAFTLTEALDAAS